MNFHLDALDRSPAGPRAILRLMQLLGYLAQWPQGRTLAQICEDLRVPKTTLFTMLRTLQGSGHLLLDQGAWRLGPPSLTLGAAMAASARRGFPHCVREPLEGLSRRTGETCFVAVLTADGLQCRYVSVIESASSLRFSVAPDSLKPSYATGTGHAMLAFLPARDRDAILSRTRFDRITGKTVRSRTGLLAVLARVRERQLAITDSGTIAGVTSVAAPIFDADGRVLAAVSVGGPSARMAPNLAGVGRIVRAAAEQISRDLGLAGDWPPA